MMTVRCLNIQKNLLSEIEHAYAITIHKSQGVNFQLLYCLYLNSLVC